MPKRSLLARSRVNLARGQAVRQRPVAESRRHGMVGDGQVRVGPPQLRCLVDQAREGLRARDFLHQMPIDVEKRCCRRHSS